MIQQQGHPTLTLLVHEQYNPERYLYIWALRRWIANTLITI